MKENQICELLHLDKPTCIVDIGALGGYEEYGRLLNLGIATLVGFEPQREAYDKLVANNTDPNVRYLRKAVGDGYSHTLNVCAAPGFSSLFTPDPQKLKRFIHFPEWARVMYTEVVDTELLNVVPEDIDYIKIDAQGSELMVFSNNQDKLRNVSVIQTEVSFVTLYQGQPTFGDVDVELRRQGFIPHHFVDLNRRMILPAYRPSDEFAAMNQLLEADLVYVKDWTKPERLSASQLKHMAVIAHYCYQSYDLAFYCFCQLIERGAIDCAAADLYWQETGKV